MKVVITILVIGIIFSILFVFISHERRIFTGSASYQVSADLTIDPEYVYTSPDQTIVFGINLLQYEGQARRDIQIDSILSDGKEVLFISKSETVAIETRTSLVSSMYLPKYLEQGSYFIIVEIKDIETGEKISSASQRIVVERVKLSPQEDNNLFAVGLILIGLTVIALVVILSIALQKIKVLSEENYQLWSSKRKV